jgi:hypothetical protein
MPTIDIVEKLRHALLRVQHIRADLEVGRGWRLVRIGQSGERRDLAALGLGVESLHVTLLAHGERRLHINLVIARTEFAAQPLAIERAGSDAGNDGDHAALGKKLCHRTDSPHILCPFRLGEAEIGAERVPQGIGIE